MFVFQSCLSSCKVLSGTFDDSAVLTGVSDTIIVRHKDGTHRATPFLASFGPYTITHRNTPVEILVNDKLVPGISFALDKKGYIVPRTLSDKQLRKMDLRFGHNDIVYRMDKTQLKAELYLYSGNDRLVVSDVDGTATVSDIGGHIHNMIDRDYFHIGYTDLMKRINQNGYKVVWLTMRSLPLYDYSKKYLKNMCGINAPILTEPEQFTNALFHEVTKKTGNIKANMVKILRSLFVENPFMGGLGNREGDAIAYLHGGIPMQKIFFVDTASRIQQMSRVDRAISYAEIVDEIEEYFPYYFSPKTGYM